MFVVAVLLAGLVVGCAQHVDVTPSDADESGSGSSSVTDESDTTIPVGLMDNAEVTNASPPKVANNVNDQYPAPRTSVDDEATVQVDDHVSDQSLTNEQVSEAPAQPMEPTGGNESHADTSSDVQHEHSPIFEKWPVPKLALFFTGEQDGYLEPCGCAGLENQKGGLKRRHTLIKQLEQQGWPVLALDLGGQVKRIGTQANIKFRHAVDSLATLGYKAVGLGPRDLLVEILGVAVNFQAGNTLFVSANVALVDFESGFSTRMRIADMGDVRVGVTSILGREFSQELENLGYVEYMDPVKALAEVVPKLKEEKCDYLVLLAHAPIEESQKLAKQFPDFDFIVTAGGAEEPPHQIQDVDGIEAKFIEVGHKGMYVSVVGIFDDAQPPLRYQRVPLDSRFDDSPEMHQMIVAYQDELKTLGLDGLGLAGSPHPSGRKYVGSKACADCHTEATEIYLDTPHAYATERLVDEKYVKPPRHFDPECLSCHATGWNPQKYFPYSSGYFGLKATPNMLGNGCENCHGPGSAHVEAERNLDMFDDATRLARQQEIKLAIVENEGNKAGQEFGIVVKMCMTCHDLDNSPEFDFQKYWPHVEHYGKE